MADFETRVKTIKVNFCENLIHYIIIIIMRKVSYDFLTSNVKYFND